MPVVIPLLVCDFSLFMATDDEVVEEILDAAAALAAIVAAVPDV